MFRELTAQEEEKFRRWARDNYVPHSEINRVWHPVVQDEAVKMNKETRRAMILIDVPVPGEADSQVYTFTGSPEKIRIDIMATIPHPQNEQALKAYEESLKEITQ